MSCALRGFALFAEVSSSSKSCTWLPVTWPAISPSGTLRSRSS